MKPARRDPPIMSAAQYRAALKTLGLSHREARMLLVVDDRTSRRWANGERDVSNPAARFLLFLIAASIKPARVFKLLDGGAP